MLHFPYFFFKYMIFQRRQKVLLWCKGFSFQVSYPYCCYIWVGTFVCKCLSAHSDFSQKSVRSLHGNHLNDPPLVQVSVETSVPFWVYCLLSLHQLNTTTWRKNIKSCMWMFWNFNMKRSIKGSYRQVEQNSRTFQGLLKDFSTVFKDWKLKKNTDLHVKILLLKC